MRVIFFNYLQISDKRGHNDTREQRSFNPSCHHDHAHRISAHNQKY